MHNVMKLACYLKRTMNNRLFYPKTQPGKLLKFELVGYADAAFRDCILTRKSTSRYLFCLNSSPITWQSKRQSLVVTSTTEAKYVATCDATKEIVWLRNLLKDMSYKQNGSIILYEDNDNAKA